MVKRERVVRNTVLKPGVLQKALNLLKKKRWSPEQISGYLRRQGISISKERIYQEIRRNPELAKYCHHHMKYRHHQARPYKTAGKSMIPDRVSIHDRPAEADGRRFGDWEMDFVVGAEQKSAVLTITTDNGIEFRNHKDIAKALECTVYFADPYCSGQKGAVENANKILREYFPKGTDFRKVTQKELDNVQYQINERHREKLNFSSPKVEFYRRIC